MTATVNLDGTGAYDIKTGVGFFDHMLEQLSRHSLIDITLKAKGDLHIDFHHTDGGFRHCAGPGRGQGAGRPQGHPPLRRLHLPMDETLTRAAIDVSGRPFLVWKVEFTAPKIGDFDTELVREWFQAFAMNAGVTLHVETLYGDNNHHIAESCFKALARCLREAHRDRSAPEGPHSLDQGIAAGLMAIYSIFRKAGRRRATRPSSCATDSPGRHLC